MSLFCIFHIGANRILAKGCSVLGKVTMARNSALYVVKKPIRLYPNEKNTMYSHFITFQYTVDSIASKVSCLSLRSTAVPKKAIP